MLFPARGARGIAGAAAPTAGGGEGTAVVAEEGTDGAGPGVGRVRPSRLGAGSTGSNGAEAADLISGGGGEEIAVAVGEGTDGAGSGEGTVRPSRLGAGSAGSNGAEAADLISGAGGADPDLAATAISARRKTVPTDKPEGPGTATDSEPRDEQAASLTRRFTREVTATPERRRFGATAPALAIHVFLFSSGG
jgi:hypothetical protein